MTALNLFEQTNASRDQRREECCDLHQEFDRLCVALARLRSYYLEQPFEMEGWGVQDRERLGEILRLLDLMPIAPRPHELGQCQTGLSPREAEILRWVARGKSNSVIAEILGISRHTVDTHIRRIYRKLGAADRTTAALRAVETGLFGETPVATESADGQP